MVAKRTHLCKRQQASNRVGNAADIMPRPGNHNSMPRFLYPVLALLLLSGCATGQDPRDPLEPMNRKIYAFNERVDKAVLKPVAEGYVAVVPSMARTGVNNVFRNLGVVVTAANNALQIKVPNLAQDVLRFSVNLVWGLGGIIDVASELGIGYHEEDFGQTLGYWGIEAGPYLVLPILGPSTMRDTVALPADFYISPYNHIDDRGTRYGVLALRVVDLRASLLSADQILQAQFDPYSFLRDVYLRRREHQVRDGKLPPQQEEGAERPKSLLELEAEEFGDDDDLDEYEAQ
jgi:phospholipid-binding lipoprotein MlaA